MEAKGINGAVPFNSLREQPKSAQSRKRVLIVSRCNPMHTVLQASDLDSGVVILGRVVGARDKRALRIRSGAN
jgi:hypothetical protein